MILITGGCSFSECISPWIDTWPKHLEKSVATTIAYHQGLGCQGNGMISREVIWRVSQLLDKKDDLLVGVMWSGFDRHELLLDAGQQPKTDYGMSVPGSDQVFNPYNWIEQTDHKWLLLHHSGDTDIAKTYYADMSNSIYSQLQTVEHILRTQWFLKLHNIKYFMTTYTNRVLDRRLCSYKDINYLYNQIDFSNFLPVVGEHEWCRDHSGLEFPIKGDPHPSSEQHKLFTEQVIVPFLTKKAYI